MSTLLAMVATSVRDSHKGLPTSSEISSASSSACCLSRSRKRVQTAMRSSSGVMAQPSKAARAAWRAHIGRVEARLAKVCGRWPDRW